MRQGYFTSTPRLKQHVRPREVLVNPNLMPLAVSYSIGEGESAGVGVVLWLPFGRAIAGHIRVAEVLRKLWTSKDPWRELETFSKWRHFSTPMMLYYIKIIRKLDAWSKLEAVDPNKTL